jgi:phosphomannomutase/phosphoglucomutase
LSDIPAYYATPEIRADCPDEIKFEIVKELKAYFGRKYDAINIDGIRILFGDGWALIRPSNTQPVIVLRFEAKTEKRLEEIKNLIRNKLEEFPSVKINF